MNYSPQTASQPAVVWRTVLATTSRILRLFFIVVWVGGLISFAFILAPTAFHVLPTTREAGAIVGATLRVLNRVGVDCGYLFILATIPPSFFRLMRPRRERILIAIEMIFVALMIAATTYVQASIIPAMDRDMAAAGGDIDAAPADNPARLDFERLHPLSEKVEGTALFLGLGVVILLGLEGRDLNVARTESDLPSQP